MKSAMQELIDWATSLQYNQHQCIDWIVIKNKAESLLETEKQQIINAFDEGQEYEYNQSHYRDAPKFDSQTYFTETYGTKESGVSELPTDHIVDTNEMVSSQTEISDEDDELKFLKKQLENVEYYKMGYNRAKETLYTEEQVIDFLKLRLMFFGIATTDSENEKWFKQFKKNKL